MSPVPEGRMGLRMTEIGKKIAGLRVMRGMSQESLARELAVSRELVSKWELGQRRPDYRTVRRIAEFFGISPDDIVDLDGLVIAELDDCVPGDVSVPRERLAEILNGFLGSMKQKDAGIFIRRYYYLQNTSEIAEAFGICENHVRSILSKTRKKLKKTIEQEKGELK